MRRAQEANVTLGTEHTWAAVIYPRDTEGDPLFQYNNKPLTPTAKPEHLTAILKYLDTRLTLKDQVKFGTYDVYPPTPDGTYDYARLSETGHGILRVPGKIAVTRAKGTLVIVRAGHRTKVWLENRVIETHPVG